MCKKARAGSLLAEPYTFSAGIVAAAAVKHDGQQRTRIVDEGVGDRLPWWSEVTRSLYAGLALLRASDDRAAGPRARVPQCLTVTVTNTPPT